MENVLDHREAGLFEVPWVKNIWTIGKTHLFVAGVSGIVFPKVIYVCALLLLGACVASSISALRRADSRLLVSLAVPLMIFGASLLYHSWRNYSYTRGSGGTGGWYLWAMLLPESLLVVWGLAARPHRAAWRTAALVAFGLLTIAGDVVLLALPGKAMVLSGREVFGVRLGALAEAWPSFLASRPAACAGLAIAFMLISWIVGAWAVASSCRENPSRLVQPRGRLVLSG
jgi:hypothetical protein